MLTHKQQILKKHIEIRREQIKVLQQEVAQIVGVCKHKIKKVKNPKSWEGAHCEICGRDFGWYCPKLPDHVCHYHSVNGRIKLINGREVLKPRNASEYETFDSCIYCRQPGERK